MIIIQEDSITILSIVVSFLWLRASGAFRMKVIDVCELNYGKGAQYTSTNGSVVPSQDVLIEAT